MCTDPEHKKSLQSIVRLRLYDDTMYDLYDDGEQLRLVLLSVSYSYKQDKSKVTMVVDHRVYSYK